MSQSNHVHASMYVWRKSIAPTCSLFLARMRSILHCLETNDHQTLRGNATVRLSATREQIARIIQLPANGMMEIRVQDLQTMLLGEAQAYMARTIQKYSNDELVQEAANEDVSIGLSLALRRTVESFGMSIDHAFIAWKQSDKVRLEAEREHATNMAEHFPFKPSESRSCSMHNWQHNSVEPISPLVTNGWKSSHRTGKAEHASPDQSRGSISEGGQQTS